MSKLGGKMIRWSILGLVMSCLHCEAAPFHIQFSIPEVKMVKEIPHKMRDFAFIIPGDSRTYVFNRESDYFADYQRSYYAVTTKKVGWDCLRHYEILASGCIPYFLNLENCPPNTMTLLPKDLILEAMHLEGVSYLHIDHSKFDANKYFDILSRLMKYTREHLTTDKMAQYILDTIGYKGQGKILFLTDDTSPDYLRCFTLIGFKQILGERIVDVPKIEHIYKNYPHDVRRLWSKGFTYTKIVDDIPVDRENIEERIRAKEFDLVIYGSLHRGLRHYALVKECYDPSQIIYLCGEDVHECDQSLNNLFLREQ